MKGKWLWVLALGVMLTGYSFGKVSADSCGMGSTYATMCNLETCRVESQYVLYPCSNLSGYGTCMGNAMSTYCISDGAGGCTEQTDIAFIPCNGGTSGGTCGGTYPQCSGSCSGGQVCKAIAATGTCNCGQPVSCSEYVPNPNLLSTVRISPTSARFRWSAIDTTAFPYVERIALVVEEVGSANFNVCKTAAMNGAASANCNVYQPNLAVTSTSYTATGALTAGTEYQVWLYFVTQDPPGILPPCNSSDTIDSYLSSCELTPDPTTVAVGGTRILTTNLVADTWNVSYSRTPTAYATVTTPDNVLPFRTTVTGVADGVVVLTIKCYTF
jgi:hypothetical protein